MTTTTTVSDIIKDALIEIGVQMPSEALKPDEAEHGLRVLNRMIQQWNIQDLMVYTLERQLFSFIVGRQSYTLGPSGDFNTARPARIQMASVQNSTLSMPVEIPITLFTDDEWRSTAVKATPSLFPTGVWQTGGVPLNTLHFWPIPQSSDYQVILYTWGKTSDFSAITDNVVFPNGYEEALVTNLAITLASSYGKSADILLIQRALNAKSLIESFNLEPLYTGSDRAILQKHGGSIGVRSFGLVVDR